MPIALANEFLTFYPEFADFPVDVIDGWLQRVEALHCPASVWTDPIRQQQAVMLRTAHYLETQRQQMAQTASIGAAVSTGQAVPSSSNVTDDLNQTSYGRQFDAMRKLLPTRPIGY